MHEREVLMVPSERVCIYLVGPLPKAKVGMEYMLTCVDVGTRWPEAIPLKSTTVKVISPRCSVGTGFLGSSSLTMDPSSLAGHSRSSSKRTEFITPVRPCTRPRVTG